VHAIGISVTRVALPLNPTSSQGGSEEMATLSIGEVAARAEVNTSHIRYYERVGVLPKPERTGGQRRYDERILHRLAIIDVAKRAGLTLAEIRDLTGPDSQGAHAGERIRALAHRKLPEVEALIARAEAVKVWLELAGACDCSSVDVCSLFTDPALAPPRATA
jgi:MerR family redox-sensitive transcriptional activator SoxR